MAVQSENVYADARYADLNRSNEQYRRYIAESGSMATSGDTQSIELDLELNIDNSEFGIPPSGLEVYTHDGGLSYTSAAASLADSNGDTLVLEVYDPQSNFFDQNHSFSEAFVTLTHAFTGLTANAATPAQVVASINGDEKLKTWVYAAITVTNRVTLFPRGSRARLRIGRDSTANAIASQFGSATADNSKRTFTRQNPSSWGLSWAPDNVNEGRYKATITNNGAAVTKVTAVLTLY